MVGARFCAVGAVGGRPGNAGTRAVSFGTAIDAGTVKANAIANDHNAVQPNSNSGSVNHEWHDTMWGTGTAGSASFWFGDTQNVANLGRRRRRPAGVNRGGRWTSARH
jgi:hypothetical protein